MSYLYELFKEMYYRELDRKDKTNARMMYPTTIIVVLSGIMGYYISNFKFVGFDFCTVVFLIATGVMFIAICWAVYCLIRANFNYGYGYISSAGEIAEDVSDYHVYFEQLGEDMVDEKTDLKIQDRLLKQFIAAAVVNSGNNNRKHKFIHRCNIGIVIGLVALLLSFPFFYVINYSTLTERAEVVNIVKGWF
jgi:hypothetical protein